MNNEFHKFITEHPPQYPSSLGSSQGSIPFDRLGQTPKSTFEVSTYTMRIALHTLRRSWINR